MFPRFDLVVSQQRKVCQTAETKGERSPKRTSARLFYSGPKNGVRITGEGFRCLFWRADRDRTAAVSASPSPEWTERMTNAAYRRAKSRLITRQSEMFNQWMVMSFCLPGAPVTENTFSFRSGFVDSFIYIYLVVGRPYRREECAAGSARRRAASFRVKTRATSSTFAVSSASTRIFSSRVKTSVSALSLFLGTFTLRELKERKRGTLSCLKTRGDGIHA